MDLKPIFVRANVRLIPSAEGGRTSPIGGGNYRPNHNFFGPDDRVFAMGFIDLPDGVELHPGGSADLQIKFWTWPEIEKEIYPGREWRIQEGPKLVAIGTIIEILPTP